MKYIVVVVFVLFILFIGLLPIISEWDENRKGKKK